MLAESERQSYLEAMGIDVYVLRARVDTAAAPAAETGTTLNVENTAASMATKQPRLVIVCERPDANSREISERQQAQIVRALGLESAQIDWLYADAKQLEREPPALHAWLVLGEHLARVLGEQLSTQQQNVSVIAVAPALPQAMLGAANKRALWQALKPIARRLRNAAAPDAALSQH